MKILRIWVIGVVLVISVTGCASIPKTHKVDQLPPTKEGVDPDLQLREYEKLLIIAERDHRNIETIRLRIEELALKFPNHSPSVMKAAQLAHAAKEKNKAQQLLDNLLAINNIHPEAAALRARIALEDGNVAYAKNLLKEQIYLSPGHASLREAYASALFIEKKYEDALSTLKVAEKLGAPKGRVYYHMGLIKEAMNDRKEAASYYRKAITEDPFLRESVNPRLLALEFEASITEPPAQ